MFSKKEKLILLFLSGMFVLGIVLRLTERDEVKIEKRLIEINQSTKEELEALPGIGPTLANRIISFRDSCGGFDCIDQLIEVKGISRRTLGKIKPYLKSLKEE